MSHRLETLHWDNSYARLPDVFHQRVAPTPLPNPRLVAFDPDSAALLDLDLEETGRPEFVGFVNGEIKIPGTDPLAALYAGHQFGVWVPQLGDGRAILMGEVVTSRGERWDVQLKGAGPTRFSRMGDGRAVLRSTIREFLASAAMHGLGVPTTRALAIVSSDAPVYRERTEPAAILVRLAPSHVRFGTFEVFASRDMRSEVQQLADYVIALHFPPLLALGSTERYAAWFGEVVDRTAKLMAQWIAVGFTHGVMNTDNMSILGLTLDYGPFAWMDSCDPSSIPNHSDPAGRYAFDQQPAVGVWNCARLGEALMPLVSRDAVLAALEHYGEVFQTEFDRLLRAKLGLTTAQDDDITMISELFVLLRDAKADYTRWFRTLSRWNPGALGDEANDAPMLGLLREGGGGGDGGGGSDAGRAWLAGYATRCVADGAAPDFAARQARMLAVNPAYVLRTWMAQEAIADAERGEFATIERLRILLKTPFTEQAGAERYAGAPPEWAREVVLSCSS